MVSGDASRARGFTKRADQLVPNQIRHLGKSLFFLGLYMPELRDASWWREESLPLFRLTHLPDGSDREQSLNYFNNAQPELLQAISRLPKDRQDAELVAAIGRESETRDRFLPSIVRPDGILPSVGKNNVWEQSGRSLPVHPPSRAFTSILFPYGGYAVLRDGWDPKSLYLFMKTSRPAIGHWRSQEAGLQVSAFGRNLLISAMGDIYDDRDGQGGWSRYWYSAAGQNSILVDGRSPVRRPWKDSPPDDALWHSSKSFDVVETALASGYGGGDIFQPSSKPEKGPPESVEIADTTHHRRVIFAREAGAWIVIDTVKSCSPRQVTQTWNFGPEYAEAEVTATDREIATCQIGSPNLVIRQFGISPSYKKYFGYRGQEGVFGWVGVLRDRDKWLYTPAVSVHAQWQNEGEQTVVSLLIPRVADDSAEIHVEDKTDDKMTGFDLILNDARRLAFRQAQVPQNFDIAGLSAMAQSLLVQSGADGSVQGLAFRAASFNGAPAPAADFEFTGTFRSRPLPPKNARTTSVPRGMMNQKCSRSGGSRLFKNLCGSCERREPFAADKRPHHEVFPQAFWYPDRMLLARS